MNIYHYIAALLEAELRLAENFIRISEYHKTEPGIYYGCQEMASISNDHIKTLKREAELYNNGQDQGNDSIQSLIKDHKTGLNLTSDLRFMWLLTMEAAMLNTFLLHASAEESENDLELMCSNFERETDKQSQWLMYRLNVAVRKAVVDA